MGGWPPGGRAAAGRLPARQARAHVLPHTAGSSGLLGTAVLQLQCGIGAGVPRARASPHSNPQAAADATLPPRRSRVTGPQRLHRDGAHGAPPCQAALQRMVAAQQRGACAGKGARGVGAGSNHGAAGSSGAATTTGAAGGGGGSFLAAPLRHPAANQSTQSSIGLPSGGPAPAMWQAGGGAGRCYYALRWRSGPGRPPLPSTHLPGWSAGRCGRGARPRPRWWPQPRSPPAASGTAALEGALSRDAWWQVCGECRKRARLSRFVATPVSNPASGCPVLRAAAVLPRLVARSAGAHPRPEPPAACPEACSPAGERLRWSDTGCRAPPARRKAGLPTQRDAPLAQADRAEFTREAAVCGQVVSLAGD